MLKTIASAFDNLFDSWKIKVTLIVGGILLTGGISYAVILNVKINKRDRLIKDQLLVIETQKLSMKDLRLQQEALEDKFNAELLMKENKCLHKDIKKEEEKIKETVKKIKSIDKRLEERKSKLKGKSLKELKSRFEELMKGL